MKYFISLVKMEKHESESLKKKKEVIKYLKRLLTNLKSHRKFINRKASVIKRAFAKMMPNIGKPKIIKRG